MRRTMLSLEYRVPTDWEELPIIFDLATLARITGLSYETLRGKARNGEIPCVKVGTQYRLEKEAVKKWLGGQYENI